MNINVSKETIFTVASVVTILAFLLNLSIQIGGINGEVGKIRGEMGELRGEIGELRGEMSVINGMVEENGRAIESLRDDMRELRGIITSHLATHVAQGEAPANTNE